MLDGSRRGYGSSTQTGLKFDPATVLLHSEVSIYVKSEPSSKELSNLFFIQFKGRLISVVKEMSLHSVLTFHLSITKPISRGRLYETFSTGL